MSAVGRLGAAVARVQPSTSSEGDKLTLEDGMLAAERSELEKRRGWLFVCRVDRKKYFEPQWLRICFVGMLERSLRSAPRFLVQALFSSRAHRIVQ